MPSLPSPAVLWPMILIVASFAAYHLITKTLRADIHPFVFLSAVYGVALLASLVLIALPGSASGSATGLKMGDVAAILVLGVALVGIEAGFILAYRAGWAVSLAPTIANVSVALVLLPLALVVLKEKVSLVNLAGLGLAVTGLVLMAHRS